MGDPFPLAIPQPFDLYGSLANPGPRATGFLTEEERRRQEIVDARLARIETALDTLVKVLEKLLEKGAVGPGGKPNDAITAACRDPRAEALATALRASPFSGAYGR